MADGTAQDILSQDWSASTTPAVQVANVKALARMVQHLEDRLAIAETVNAGLQAQIDVLAVPDHSSTVSRDLDSDFVIDIGRDVDVRYAIKLPTKLLAIGSDEATVALVIDGSEVHRVSNRMTLGVGLSINDLREPIQILSGRVGAGQTVHLTTIVASINASPPSFFSGQETLL